MPKSKRHEMTRTSSRRQASKEALKQMQLLLDDDEDETFVVPDDDDSDVVRLEAPKKRAVSPVVEPPPKKKYKLSHRKSSDGNDRDVIVLKSISQSNYVPKEETLELECFVEELSDVQLERRKQIEAEETELESNIKELLKGKEAEIVFKGNYNMAVEVNELISNGGKKTLFKPALLPQLGTVTENTEPTYHLVMDPCLGLIVGTVQKKPTPVTLPSTPATKSKLSISSAVKAVATIRPQSPPGPRITRTRRGTSTTPTTTPVQSKPNNTRSLSATPAKGNNQTILNNKGNNTVTRANAATPTRATTTHVATPIVPSIQTRAMKITTPALQTRNSKTPSTSSAKRPLANISGEKPKQIVDLTADDNRTQVDNREISFNKLQGKTYPSLVVVARPHLRVTDLGAGRSKLDSKVKSVLMHPPAKFTEWLIQQGVIRAEQKCPVHTNTLLKLGMYSDASKFPFSGGYVWISECCPQRFISVFNGSIFEGSPHPPVVMLKLIYHWSCQTNIQNVTQWVKVDNLYVKGVYTWLRGICTVAIHNRVRQLGGPGCKIEVGVISLGTTSHDGNQRQVKVEVLGILESSTKNMRLRAVEPLPEGERNFRKKFSKILEPILLWVHPASTIVTDMTVDKSTLHSMGFTNVIQSTSNEYNNSNRIIMEYLRRIVPRMFQNTLSLLSRQIIQQFLDELVWREWFGVTAQQAFDNIISHLAEQTRTNTQPSLILKLNKVAANPFRNWNATPISQATTSTTTPAVSSQTSSSTSINNSLKTPVNEVRRQGRGRKTNSPQVPSVQERPTKPVSPDVPEQMVPLENYYYGTIDCNDQPPPKSAVFVMKCPFCKSSFENNLQLQTHLFKHAHNVSNDAYLCRYCLTSVSTANELLFHVNKFHPGETKFSNGFVCLICESHYMNPFVLGKHMSKEHNPHELPYQCGTCSFRCSNHKQIIDHFYIRHDGGTSIQCPFCLKSTTIWSGGRNVTQNVHYFIQHLQKHQKKQLAKRCGKCNLWFVQKDILKEHQQKMHVSLRGRLGLIPSVSPRNGVMVPKSKVDKNPCDGEIINFSSLYYNIPNDVLCKECEEPIASSKHFPSFDTCQNPNCQFSTCCATAMMTHNIKCKGLNTDIPPEKLPFDMFCICGHKDSDGNSMAKHLAICEKKSAYPSKAEAKTATVMHSMLDILGLVRKPEETHPPASKEKKTENQKKVESKTKENVTEISILSDDEDVPLKKDSEKNKVTLDDVDSEKIVNDDETVELLENNIVMESVDVDKSLEEDDSKEESESKTSEKTEKLDETDDPIRENVASDNENMDTENEERNEENNDKDKTDEVVELATSDNEDKEEEEDSKDDSEAEKEEDQENISEDTEENPRNLDSENAENEEKDALGSVETEEEAANETESNKDETETENAKETEDFSEKESEETVQSEGRTDYLNEDIDPTSSEAEKIKDSQVSEEIAIDNEPEKLSCENFDTPPGIEQDEPASEINSKEVENAIFNEDTEKLEIGIINHTGVSLNDEVCKESGDNLDEVALDDILSSTSNVAAMDVDLESELTDIAGVPMDVD